VEASRDEDAEIMLTPPSQEIVVLLGLIGLLIFAVRARRRIREFLRRFAEALYDEWQWPR